VASPYWRKGWFLALAALAGAGALGAVVRFVSLRHLRRKLQRLQEAHAIEKERMRIAQDMHDELGGKLSRISFLSDMARRQLPDGSETSQQIDEVSDAARDIIHTVDEIVWAVSPRNDTVESFVHYICRHAEEFFELTPVDLELELPGEFPSHRFPAEVRHNLFCAVKEALHNVLKHAGATKVQIAFATEPAALRLSVTDNGCGFAREPAERTTRCDAGSAPRRLNRTGDGLLNMRERLESVHGACALRSAPGQGTRVDFSVPLK
jgi:signal transduction histidine kinase